MDDISILRTALKTNGFFSLATAILTLLLGNSILAFNEMANGKPMVLAIQLFIFAAVVLFAAYRRKVPVILVWVIIVLDILYVLLGFYNLSLVASETSLGGKMLMVITNVMVALFATFQTLGIIRYRKSLAASKS